MSDDLDLTIPLREGLLADAGIVAALPSYGSNGKTIFSRRPVPSDAPYPMIVISPDVTLSDNDGIDHERPIVVRDIAIYGKNEPASNYRQVEDVAYAVRHLFHSRKDTLPLTGIYKLIDIRASGPRPAPTNDLQTVGRMVELTIRLAMKPEPPPVPELPYVAGAVHFDSLTHLLNPSLIAAASPLFTFVMWFKTTNNKPFFMVDYDGAEAPVSLIGAGAFAGSHGLISHELAELPAFDNYVSKVTAGPSFDDDVWHCMVFSANCSTPPPRKFRVYVDDVDQPFDVTATDAGSVGFNVSGNGYPVAIGSNGHTKFIGDIADLRIFYGVSLLDGSGDIPLAKRRLFRDASGKPVKPSVATAQLGVGTVLFSGDAASFGNNQGTGGAFTITGSFTNASTSPSA